MCVHVPWTAFVCPCLSPDPVVLLLEESPKVIAVDESSGISELISLKVQRV